MAIWRKSRGKINQIQSTNETLLNISTFYNSALFCRALKAANVTSVGELVKVIAMLKSRIYKAKNRSKPEQAPVTASESVSQTSQDESALMKEKMEMWIAKMRHKR